MGLFSKGLCCVCNERQSRKKLADGYICESCAKEVAEYIETIGMKSIRKRNVLDIMETKPIMEANLIKFKATKTVSNYLEIDEKNKLWKAKSTYPKRVFSFDEIIDFELIQNGEVISKGGLREAVVGGALFGETGAIVGSLVGKKTVSVVTEFYIKIRTKNLIYPKIRIYFWTLGSKTTDSFVYRTAVKEAEDVIDELRLICGDCKVENENEAKAYSQADEIAKFKKLLDDGVITEEEFEAKKKQLLGL